MRAGPQGLPTRRYRDVSPQRSTLANVQAGTGATTGTLRSYISMPSKVRQWRQHLKYGRTMFVEANAVERLSGTTPVELAQRLFHFTWGSCNKKKRRLIWLF